MESTHPEKRISFWAIGSFLLIIIGIYFAFLGVIIISFLAGIAVILCGHIARVKIKKNRERLSGIFLANCSLIIAYTAFTVMAIKPAKDLLFILELQKQTSSGASEEELGRLCFQSLIPKRGSIGIVVGISRQGRHKIYRYGNPTFDGDTEFEIGSVTKVFTSLALACLVQDGVVNLSDPIKEFLPKDVHPPSINSKDIQLAHLSTHTSGLSREPYNLNDNYNRFVSPAIENPHAGYDIKRLYEAINTTKLNIEPGKRFEYSNFGGALLGQLLTNICNSDYESVIRQNICIPFDMEDTWSQLPERLSEKLAPPYLTSGFPSSNMEVGAFAGAGGLHSTVNDLLIFLDEHISPVHPRLRKAIDITLVERFQINNTTSIGLGWICTKRNGKIYWWHNGRSLGYSSYIGMEKENHLGIVVLSNANYITELTLRGEALLKALSTIYEAELTRQPINSADPKSLAAD